MPIIDAWPLLSGAEQAAISNKIAGSEAFNRLVEAPTPVGTTNKVILVQNFIESADGLRDGAIWRQVRSIFGIWLGQEPDHQDGGGVIMTVDDRELFLQVLEQNGYVVNAWYEIFSKHRQDSAREITETSWETAMHFANDEPGESTRFYVHWDQRSVAFRKRDPKYPARLIEQLAAGRSHHQPFPAAEIRERLKEQKRAGRA